MAPCRQGMAPSQRMCRQGLGRRVAPSLSSCPPENRCNFRRHIPSHAHVPGEFSGIGLRVKSWGGDSLLAMESGFGQKTCSIYGSLVAPAEMPREPLRGTKRVAEGALRGDGSSRSKGSPRTASEARVAVAYGMPIGKNKELSDGSATVRGALVRTARRHPAAAR